MEISEIRIVEKLMELDYTERSAKALSERLIKSDIIREPLMCWLETGEETDCFYEEISAFALMRERRFQYPNALNVIDWLHRDPQAARQALSRGVDRIIRRKE